MDSRRVSASYFIPSGPKTTHTKLRFLLFQKWLETTFSIISPFCGKKEKQSLNPSFLRKQVKKPLWNKTKLKKYSLEVSAVTWLAYQPQQCRWLSAALLVVFLPFLLFCWVVWFFFLHLGCFKLLSDLGFYLLTGASWVWTPALSFWAISYAAKDPGWKWKAGL